MDSEIVQMRMIRDGPDSSGPRDLETMSRRLMLSGTPSSGSIIQRKHLFGIKVTCVLPLG
jgi:hypothetical protein